MVTLLMVLFIIMSLLLAFFILLQQGKGDMGLGSLSNSTQMLFGGSGGQNFFEKVTWALGGLFIFGALGLSHLQSRRTQESRLASFTVQKPAATATTAATASVDDAGTTSEQEAAS